MVILNYVSNTNYTLPDERLDIFDIVDKIHVKVLTNAIPVMYPTFYLKQQVQRYFEFPLRSWQSKGRSFVHMSGRIELLLRFS